MQDHHPSVVNVADSPWHEFDHGDKFAGRDKWLADAAGGQELGCSRHEQPPAKAAFNTSDATLRDHCLSTMPTPEIVRDPASGELGVSVGQLPGWKRRRLLPLAASADDRDGE